jgi:hypothetical protein
MTGIYSKIVPFSLDDDAFADLRWNEYYCITAPKYDRDLKCGGRHIGHVVEYLSAVSRVYLTLMWRVGSSWIQVESRKFILL